MRPDVLISDKLHIHKRNFFSLFKFLESSNIAYREFSEYDELRNNTLETYCSSEKLSKYDDILHSDIDVKLYNLKHCGVSVFEIARAELLSHLVYKGLTSFSFSSTRELFDYLYSGFLDEMLAAYRVAMFWLDVWREELLESNYKFAIIFSGSSISAKALLYLCRFNSTEPLLAEGFFTGKHYYLENKYEPIANNSDLRFASLSFNPEIDFPRWPKTCEYISSVGVFNKNVKQPKEKCDLPFDNYLLLTCQVVNDYSLIDSSRKLVSSVELYKRIIKEVVEETNFNLIVKVHPWERNKTESRSPVTFDALSQYLEGFNPQQSKRVFLTEDSNLSHLISNSITTMTLCSQSGLEACFLGKKPITIGGAFYSNKGFTYDVESPVMLGELLNNNFDSELTLIEFNKYIAFMNHSLCDHLVRSDCDVFNRLPVILAGCKATSQVGGVGVGTFKYEMEQAFLKRNLLKAVENPSQLVRDFMVICSRIGQKA
ncbi:hypothetical protein ACJJIF_06755 [Microbulbifer sp. SSSA002]|uniref:capsular polysaccharide export protein, LipB/KpsS family n=1 Tax=Microbulbifer sp. SSSA002 TaxID=3243376 RepID=UPI00403A4B2B